MEVVRILLYSTQQTCDDDMTMMVMTVMPNEAQRKNDKDNSTISWYSK